MIMRLHQVLIERIGAKNLVSLNDSLDSRHVELLADIIEANARPWLDATSNGRSIIYRGVVNPPHPFIAFTRTPRDNRKPKDTRHEIHKIANAMIASVGFPGYADRSNSVFCISSDIQASEYGNLFVAVPLGDFRYTWSPIYADFYSLLGHDAFYSTVVHLLKDEIASKYIFAKDQVLADYERQIEYHKGHIAKADASSYERDRHTNALHNLKSAIGRAEFFRRFTNVPSSPPRDGEQFAMQTLIKLLSDPNNYDPRLVEDIIMTDRGLETAISKQHEIMLRSTNILYIVPELYQLVLHRLETGHTSSLGIIINAQRHMERTLSWATTKANKA